MNKMGLLQDESEGYEPQRLSKWFASRLDAREVVRNNFRKELTNVRSKHEDETVLCSQTLGDFWGVTYDEGNEELDAIADDVHGGFTYTSVGDDGYWYFGFDTNHYNDFCPAIVEELIKNGLIEKDIKYGKYYDFMNYKTWEFVEDQIHWLGKRLWSYDQYHGGCRNV